MQGDSTGANSSLPVLRQVIGPVESSLERAIRNEVFVKEQGVPPELEFENESTSVHYLLWQGGRAVGCGRYRMTGEGCKLERIAVLGPGRGKGYGRAIVEGLLSELKGRTDRIYLNSQTAVMGFYETCGFKAEGKVFMEAGIAHVRMIYRKDGADV